MRIHVTYRGKKTTISIDDVLLDYLGAWMVEGHQEHYAEAKFQMDLAISQARKFATNLEKSGAAARNLSQQVQGLIIGAISAPRLIDIIEARGPRYKKPPPEEFVVPQEWCDKYKDVFMNASDPGAAINKRDE